MPFKTIKLERHRSKGYDDLMGYVNIQMRGHLYIFMSEFYFGENHLHAILCELACGAHNIDSYQS